MNNALLLLVHFFGLLCCETPKTRSYFRTKLNDKVIADRIHAFAYWNEVQSQEVDIAFERYQKGPYIQKRFPKEAAIIFQLIEQDRFLGIAAEAHEKWEVLEYLKNGYSLEDISSGKAYEEYKPHAHAVARYKELRLYQWWHTQLFGGDPPAMRAFLFTHPVLKILVEDVYSVEISTEIVDGLIRELREYESIVRAEKCSRDDIEKAMSFFERTGYDYGTQRGLFLNRGLMLLEK
ncbi:MAG: hypothetical protein AAB539_01570 [Patescibacteria group bacterium]|mgnify:CR=1 FL=1